MVFHHCRRLTREPGTPEGDPSFRHEHDDLTDPVVADEARRDSRMFLTREAALEHARHMYRLIEATLQEAAHSWCVDIKKDPARGPAP